MTERARDWFQSWLTPGVLINVIGFLLLLGGGWVRLERLEKQVEKAQDQIESLQVNGRNDAQNWALELVRYQERVSALSDRLRSLETFKIDQEQINTGLFSRIAKMGG